MGLLVLLNLSSNYRGTTLDSIHLALAVALIVCLLALLLLYRVWTWDRSRLHAAQFSRQSLSTRYGKMTEQFMPFVSSFPWDPGRFRFIGSPIDGVQFEDDMIILVEFKSGGSRLSARQRRIRELVQSGRVEFKELRLE